MTKETVLVLKPGAQVEITDIPSDKTKTWVWIVLGLLILMLIGAVVAMFRYRSQVAALTTEVNELRSTTVLSSIRGGPAAPASMAPPVRRA